MTEKNRTLVSPCGELEQDLVLFHYGDLGVAERETLQIHLKSCAACAGYVKDLGTVLPLTIATDEPAQSFWTDYNRELRQKIDDLVEKKTWRQSLAAFFQPRWVPAIATATIVALALTFTVGRDFWTTPDPAENQAAIMELLPVAENLEFFNAMEVLDNLELLESMGNQGNAA